MIIGLDYTKTEPAPLRPSIVKPGIQVESDGKFLWVSGVGDDSTSALWENRCRKGNPRASFPGSDWMVAPPSSKNSFLQFQTKKLIRSGNREHNGGSLAWTLLNKGPLLKGSQLV